MNHREAILADVRRGLGRNGEPPPSPPAARIVRPQVPRAARVESMLQKVIALAGTAVHLRTGEEARRFVAALTGGQSAIASNALVLREYGITTLPGVRSGVTEEAELRGLCATASFGISSADYALSDTGSLVMLASPAEARLISLLPPVHIAVVPVDRLLSGLDELFTLLPLPAEQTSSMVFITGPSRTADIEQILVRGVHGPGEVHVVIVGE